ncbi:peptidoglycan-binding protein [Streptomyces sp. NPDC058052]|uniref:peptidoglycan-binding domain-containing protein n=1 Tax=Streptomyces sp. NPDC058052 TaxID=3346316 RepID=UPI0036E379B9
MRNRTALTEAVAPRAPEPEPRATGAQGDDVFGKVARPGGGGGPGARVQDVELFDGDPAPPGGAGQAGGSREPAVAGARGRHGAGRRGRRAPRAARRRARTSGRDERSAGLSLPLLIAGALAAGIGLTVGLTSRLDHAGPDSLTLTMPDLPPPSSAPDAEPPDPGPSRTSSAPPAPVAAPSTGTGAPSAAAGTPSAGTSAGPAASSAPARPRDRGAAPTSAPPVTAAPEPSATRSARPTGKPGTEGLRVGSTGPEVEDLQRRLQRLFLYLGSVDGTFSPFLEAALIRFQGARDIPEERGVYGPLTRAALHAETGLDEDGPDGGGRGDGDDSDDRDDSDDDRDDDRDGWGGWGGAGGDGRDGGGGREEWGGWGG